MRRKVIALYVIIPSWSLGFFWALCPLLGWGSYISETGYGYRCSINIEGKDASHLTYSYNLLFWCYVIPIFVMGYCFNGIRSALKHSHNQGVILGIKKEMITLRKQTERRVTIMSMVMIVTFLLAWTPYAICLLVITCAVQVPSKLFSFSTVFAKLSTLYNPLVYMIFMKDFRMRLRKMVRLKPTNVVHPQLQRQSGSNRLTGERNTSQPQP